MGLESKFYNLCNEYVSKCELLNKHLASGRNDLLSVDRLARDISDIANDISVFKYSQEVFRSLTQDYKDQTSVEELATLLKVLSKRVKEQTDILVVAIGSIDDLLNKSIREYGDAQKLSKNIQEFLDSLNSKRSEKL